MDLEWNVPLFEQQDFIKQKGHIVFLENDKVIPPALPVLRKLPRSIYKSTNKHYLNENFKYGSKKQVGVIQFHLDSKKFHLSNGYELKQQIYNLFLEDRLILSETKVEAYEVERTNLRYNPAEFDLQEGLTRLFCNGVEIMPEGDYKEMLNSYTNTCVKVHAWARYDGHEDENYLDLFLRSKSAKRVLQFAEDPIIQFFEKNIHPCQVVGFKEALTNVIELKNPDASEEVGDPLPLADCVPFMYNAELHPGEYFDVEIDEEKAMKTVQARRVDIMTDLHALMISEIGGDSKHECARDRFEYNYKNIKKGMAFVAQDPKHLRLERVSRLFNYYRLIYIYANWYFAPSRSNKEMIKERSSSGKKQSVYTQKNTNVYRVFQCLLLHRSSSCQEAALDLFESILTVMNKMINDGVDAWLEFTWERNPGIKSEWNNFVFKQGLTAESDPEVIKKWKIWFTEKQVMDLQNADYIQRSSDGKLLPRISVEEISSFYSKQHTYNGRKQTFSEAFETFLKEPEKEWGMLRRFWVHRVQKFINYGIGATARNVQYHPNTSTLVQLLERLEQLKLPTTYVINKSEIGSNTQHNRLALAAKKWERRKKPCANKLCTGHEGRLLMDLVMMNEQTLLEDFLANGADVNSHSCCGGPKVTAFSWIEIEDKTTASMTDAEKEKRVEDYLNDIYGRYNKPSVWSVKTARPLLDVNTSFGYDAVTPLALACVTGNKNLVEILLAQGANPILHDAIAIKYCIEGASALAHAKSTALRNDYADCFMQLLSWCNKNLKQTLVQTPFKESFCRQILLIEALKMHDLTLVDFLLGNQFDNQPCTESTSALVLVLEVIDHLIDAGTKIPIASHGHLLYGIQILLEKCEFSLDHYRFQSLCNMIELAVRENLPGNEQALIGLLTNCSQLRISFGLEPATEYKEKCISVQKKLTNKLKRKRFKQLFKPEEGRFTVTYLKRQFFEDIFEEAVDNRMYKLSAKLLETININFGQHAEKLLFNGVVHEDFIGFDMVLSYYECKLPKRFLKNLIKMYHDLMADNVYRLSKLTLHETDNYDKTKRDFFKGSLAKKATHPLITASLARVIKLVQVNNKNELLPLNDISMKWMMHNIVATRRDILFRDRIDEDCQFVYEYYLKKCTKENCSELVEGYVKLVEVKNLIAVERLQVFFDRCVELDHKMLNFDLNEKFDFALRKGLLAGDAELYYTITSLINSYFIVTAEEREANRKWTTGSSHMV